MSAQAEGSGKRILQNGGWLLAPKSLGAILSFVYLAIIARSLGPAEFGDFALMFSFAQAVAGIAAFQTWQIMIRYGTQPLLEGRHDIIARLVLLCLLLDLASFLLGTILAAAGVYLLGERLGWDETQQFQIFLLTVILLLSSKITASGLLRLYDEYKRAALIDSLVPILRFIAVLLVYFDQPNALKYAAIWVLTETIPAIVIWAIIFRRIKLPFRQIRPFQVKNHLAEFPSFMTYSWWSSIGYSLRFMNQQIVVLIVGFYATITAAGFFRLGHQLGQVLARISDGISMAFFLEFAKVDAGRDEMEAKRLISKTIIVTTIGSAILLLLLFLFGRPALELAFGADYLPAFPFVLLLGAAAAVQVGTMALEPVLMTRGHAGRTLVAHLIGALSLLFLIAVLMPRYGALGAAMAVLGAAIFSALAMALAFRRSGSSATTTD